MKTQDFPASLPLAWLNFPLTLFVTQRGFQLAFPLGVFLLWRWSRLFVSGGRAERAFGTLVLGFLPIVHFHTFLFVGGFLGFQWLLMCSKTSFSWFQKETRPLLFSLLAASLLYIPFLLYLTEWGDRKSALQWQWGFMDWGWKAFAFWPFELGVWFFLLLAALVQQRMWVKGSTSNRYSFLYALSIFIMMNFVTVGMWNWDNTKILSFAFLLLVWSLQPGIKMLLTNRKIICNIVLIFLTLNGAIFLYQRTFHSTPNIYNKKETTSIGSFVRSRDPKDIFAANALFNHALGFWGRPMLMGYSFHLWSHGLTFSKQQNLLHHLMQSLKSLHKSEAKPSSTQPSYYFSQAKEMGVRYIYWGESERIKHACRSCTQVVHHPQLRLSFSTPETQIYEIL